MTVRHDVERELAEMIGIDLDKEILYGPPPMLFIYCSSIDQGRYYWQREHPEFLERFVVYFTSANRNASRGRHFIKGDIVMAVGNYYDDPLFRMFLDIERSLVARSDPRIWPQQELHLR